MLPLKQRLIMQEKANAQFRQALKDPNPTLLEPRAQIRDHSIEIHPVTIFHERRIGERRANTQMEHELLADAG